MTTPTQDAIDHVRNDAADWIEIGRTAVRGMTYEQGVAAALEWVMGHTADVPIEESARNAYPDQFD